MSQYGPKWQHTTPTGLFISTSFVMFSGWETMVFLVLENGDVDYRDLDSQRYSNENEAYLGHLEMYMKWEHQSAVK